MCLSSIDRKTKFDNEGVGYKVFAPGLKGEFYAPTKKRPIGKWLKSTDYPATGRDIRGMYKPGWHIFLCREDAESWVLDDQVVRKVKYRGFIAGGISNNRRCVVAREILIIRGRAK